jgi:proteasome lid subunit RPN8/RPN11
MTPPPRAQAMPMERSILWNPPAAPGTTAPGRPSTRSPYPIFFQQEAVVALQEHLKSSPTQAIFGFLIGDVYRDPETGVLYTIIDKTLKLSQAIYGDKTEVVVSRLWDRMQEQLAKASAHLLGWYHSHPGQGGFLTAHDVETHQKYFTDPWHVAILVAAEAGGVTGRFFRSSAKDDWHKTPLPFYELLQPDSIKPDGKKRSFITWRNYKAYGPTLTAPKQKPAPPPPPPAPPPQPPPPAPVEDEVEEEVEAPAPEPVEKKQDRGFRIMRSSADDIPVIKTSADDEPAPPPMHEPPPPPMKTRPAAPVFVPDEPPAPKPPPPPPKPPPAPVPPPPPVRSSDDIPWQVTPETVASIPPEVAAPAHTPRRTPAPAFRLLEEGEQKQERGFRIMRSSADDIPVIKTSADDEPAPPPTPEPPPPPMKTRPAAPVFVPDEPPAPRPPPAPPKPPPLPPPPPAPMARSSDDIPWQVTPETVASIPPEVAVPAPRRTPAPAFRLLEEEERKPATKVRRRKRRGPWLRRLVILLLLAGVGAGAYWYFALRNPGVPPPWAGLLDKAKQLVSRVTTRTPPPPVAGPRRTTPVRPAPAPPPQATAPPPAPPPQAASPFARFDRLSDSLSRAVRNFHDRATLFTNGQMDCGGLAGGLVAIENLWISYNTERRARMTSFDPRRAAQDQALYAAVDSVESRFEHSGCPRP